MSKTITLPCDAGEVSDGFHTFNELYDHRCLLFIALMKSDPTMAWFSMFHHDQSYIEGYFVAGMTLPTGKTITYHMPTKFFEFAKSTHAAELDFAPPWDGHTSRDVIARLTDWL